MKQEGAKTWQDERDSQSVTLDMCCPRELNFENKTDHQIIQLINGPTNKLKDEWTDEEMERPIDGRT